MQEILHTTHLLKLLDKMYKYEMNPTDGETDGQTDGQMDGVKPIYPATTSLCGGYTK